MRIRFPGRLRRWFLLDWDSHVAAWITATGDPRAATVETTAVLQDMLEKQLDRVTSSLEGADTKAALVIPGVGVIATLVVGHINDTSHAPAIQLGLIIAMAVAASGSVLLSLLCLAPSWKRANGPAPLPAVLSTGEDELRVRVSYLNQLGLAVETAVLVLNAKARLLNWAIRLGGVATLALMADAAAGGLK